MLPSLQSLIVFLRTNSDIVVEIGGHTNNYPSTEHANELSTRRAKAVADWLAAQGIAPDRVPYKGYGKICPVADNRTPEGRKQNMRVEATILIMNPQP